MGGGGVGGVVASSFAHDSPDGMRTDKLEPRAVDSRGVRHRRNGKVVDDFVADPGWEDWNLLANHGCSCCRREVV